MPLAYTPGTLLLAALIVAWAIAWVVGAIDIFRRRDLGVGGKILWLLVILLVPVLGLFIYYIISSFSPNTHG